uniref:F-box domain-containing protein n=1 Tax=Heterorhabditis bacteriophora TaxID=37862 RepID=A0A1I7WAQ5_HETBA
MSVGRAGRDGQANWPDRRRMKSLSEPDTRQPWTDISQRGCGVVLKGRIYTLVIKFIITFMDFSMMPEEVLINVLRCASPTTVSIAKRMNKRMHRIVERSNLGRPKVEDFRKTNTVYNKYRGNGFLSSR